MSSDQKHEVELVPRRPAREQVVGFSVDYTIHLSDAYLESDKATRTERTQEMLAIMGPSVLSG